MSSIGIVDSASPVSRGEELEAFFAGLASTGIDRQTTPVLYAWADNDYSRLPALAQAFINNSDVGVIVTAGGPVSAIETKRLTSTKPIVFTTVTNPVASGLVQSLNAPGGNATGTAGNTSELDQPRLQMLADITRTNGGALGILANPNRPFPTDANAAQQRSALQAMATAVGRPAIVVDAGSPSQIDSALSTFLAGSIVALLVTADPLFASRREQVVKLARDLNVPAVFQWGGFVAGGGMMSYGPDKKEGYRNAGEFAGLIMQGAQPGSLPVKVSNVFSVSINNALAQSFNVGQQSPVFTDMVAKLNFTELFDF